MRQFKVGDKVKVINRADEFLKMNIHRHLTKDSELEVLEVSSADPVTCGHDQIVFLDKLVLYHDRELSQPGWASAMWFDETLTEKKNEATELSRN